MTATWIGFLILWLAWWASWWAASRWSAETTQQLSPKEENRHRVFLVAGMVLLLVPLAGIQQMTRICDVGEPVGWALLGAAALGFAFCWWARLHLGRLWSATIARKADHRIVDSGPYRLVRHPIYTGIIAAALATALAHGTALAIAGAVLVIVSLSMKARMEENFLRQQLGAEAYGSYARRVPMLVPFWPARG